MLFKYRCIECGWTAEKGYEFMVCRRCQNDMRPINVPSVVGTRDNFGVNKSFIDENTGKEITNWKEWERAGYRDADNFVKNPKIKAGIKRKKDKMKHDNKQRFSVAM